MSEKIYSISVHIDDELARLPSSPFKPSIFRIPDYLKSENENLLVPKLVSIGPIYHGKDHLHKMEQHKLRYLKLLLKRLEESSVDKYVKAIKSLEEQVRSCYADPIDLKSDDFVKMLLLDGCFIIELIRKYQFHGLRENNDPIFESTKILVHDMMLLENQVPFFILDRLFSMTSNIGNLPDNDLISLIQLMVEKTYWPNGGWQAFEEVVSKKDPNHMLDLMYETWCPSFDQMTASKGDSTALSIHSAIELQEAGIEFKNDILSKVLDITFVKGVLRIPTFHVGDETESMFKNLLLYEQLSNVETSYVSDYIFFFQYLISSSKDVEILRFRGILDNLPGDDDMLNQMFKRLGKNIICSGKFCYASVFDEVNENCKRSKYIWRLHRNRRRRRWKKWMADLKHNYFNSPWAYISFMAAVVLLLLTLLQTIFSILSYAK